MSISDKLNDMLNEATVISKKTVTHKGIINFKKLPKEIQELIKSVDNIEADGFKDIVGHIGSKAIFSANGSWEKDKFYIDSIGGVLKGKKLQWKEE